MVKIVKITLAAVVVLSVLAFVMVYHQSQAETQLTPEFHKAAQYALDLINDDQIAPGEITKAMAMADAAQRNDADGKAYLILSEYKRHRARLLHGLDGTENDSSSTCAAAAPLVVALGTVNEEAERCLAELDKRSTP